MSHVNMSRSQPEPGSDLLLSIEATEMRLNPDYVKFYLIYTNFIILRRRVRISWAAKE